MNIADIAQAFGNPWFDHQLRCFDEWQGLGPTSDLQLERMCIYYPTGTGKTSTALACMAMRDVTEVLVLAPPVTQDAWVREGAKVGITVHAMSHAKFRMKDTRLDRNMPLIVDEMHLLGGHDGKGWSKLDRAASGLKAPLILLSATPNYNDAERCYCIVHILSPWDHRGGYLTWIIDKCEVEYNPYGQTPIVKNFRSYKTAADYLAAQPGVVYLPDTAPDIVVDIPIQSSLPREFIEYGLDRANHRLMATQMEYAHKERYLQIVNTKAYPLKVHDHIRDQIETLVGEVSTPSILYFNHEQIGRVLFEQLVREHVKVEFVSGKDSKKDKIRKLNEFVAGEYDILIGTATMATGPDGMDRMCDQIIIVDDTTDASLRRQLVGRVLPRGANKDFSRKIAPRFKYL